MTASLTAVQRQILDVVVQYVQEHGYAPSVRELGRLTGRSSSSTTLDHLKRLEQKGFIRRDSPRAITILRHSDGSSPIRFTQNDLLALDEAIKVLTGESNHVIDDGIAAALRGLRTRLARAVPT